VSLFVVTKLLDSLQKEKFYVFNSLDIHFWAIDKMVCWLVFFELSKCDVEIIFVITFEPLNQEPEVKLSSGFCYEIFFLGVLSVHVLSPFPLLTLSNLAKFLLFHPYWLILFWKFIFAIMQYRTMRNVLYMAMTEFKEVR
jgi:hypothetical protein